jgi:DNA sulfur modification protein DndD
LKGEEEQWQAEKDKDSTQLASKVRDLLREFSTMIRKKKLQQVSIEFVEAFNSLAAKKNLIDKIQIGEEDFSLKIYRKDGVVLPKNQLSAGEKQIYAIAMLTALARVSGRPLPFIIDTPLARLDSQHRRNLVQNFFPKVSHQVIMFSTNTEIDKEYFELLEPSTSRAYLLTYDENTESTSEYPGYFWKPTKVFGQI